MNISKSVTDLKQLIECGVFELPYQRNSELSFYDFIVNKLDIFIDHLNKQNFDDIISNISWTEALVDSQLVRIKSFAEGIKRTISLYLEGKVLQSTTEFFGALDRIYFHGDDLATSKVTKIGIGGKFYRIRRVEQHTLTRAEMFHIPFQKRHLVSTQRYSIPGLPTLYLGDTIFICWEELNRPKIRDFCAIKLENKISLSVIEIQRKEDLLASIDSVADESQKLTALLRYIVTFPLIFVCSIKTLYPNSPFRTEYIVPQMLLQYIAERNIDGIKSLFKFCSVIIL